ncbi:MAG: hypothetical protein A2381_08820 [Bdellovibrionales bacterium RIFOXYB1_FULL_37_110]|nr:MAG: hypothetical protein A2181_09015 [Bdellovibrionales bacterium RIFOXYA1_FULL_38_20]OFZ51202.1 MAG: hypothetical protein A2417_17340 [Bdellovibrionales bacterium RIFOXYC1_FULL_37_79]OFZ60942.1 MAG: hypothetical protein A2381_08820 [Bdellovibrionales bacterium RIFOXYB1_FULL_37_110]OFZ63686.1 MAG: hypothetical protein A2577_07940 [Bdellovibrionales bacterium RIFOXYD1_FULL_36_51]
MEKIVLFVFGLIFFSSAHASQVVGVFNENSNLWINIKDNPTQSGPYEAAIFFEFLNVPITQRPYKSPVKIISTEDFTITCVVPLMMEPSRIQFSDCSIELISGSNSTLSESTESASFHLSGESALQLYSQFSVKDSNKFIWKSLDKQIYIESTKYSFDFQFQGR